jgi:mediator of RNA polymerase II transcription subunit 20
MGVSCVQSIAISDGRSGQQIIDTISKQLESMNGRKCGTYCVESDTYYSS